MEDPGSESDPEAHRLMTEKHGERVQIVLDDAAVTQMRFIIPFLAAPDRKDRKGNSVLIKLNQAGTFTETRLASEITLGLADVDEVEEFLDARKDLKKVLAELKELGVGSLKEALNNIKKNGFSAFFSHRSTEGTSEFLPYMPLMYGAVSNKMWFKAGAPNGERNLQNYNPLIRAEEQMKEKGIKTVVAGFDGLPDEVTVPAMKKLK
jgi:enolase